MPLARITCAQSSLGWLFSHFLKKATSQHSKNTMPTTDEKTPSVYRDAVDEGDDGSGIDEKRGNAQDRADMYRMGKAQEMKVR